MSKYSYLNKKRDLISNADIWPSITLSETTKSKRAELKARLDKYCSFNWRNTDAFASFGAFIINNNDLKFYNGATYTNNYTKPQFESAAGTLTGVSFSTAKIAFTIGVYWIKESDYRQLIYWLHPYEIAYLSFGFDTHYMYLVKLASISDTSTRTVIGREDDEDVYYTELKLVFDIQGEPCAYNQEPFKIENIEENGITGPQNGKYVYEQKLVTTDSVIGTDLSIPFITNFNMNKPSTTFINADSMHLKYIAEYRVNNAIFDSQVLFDIDLSNRIWTDENYLFTVGTTLSAQAASVQNRLLNTNYQAGDPLVVKETGGFRPTTDTSSFTSNDKYRQLIGANMQMSLKYDSNTGLIYILDGGPEGVFRPLTLQTTITSGERIVNSLVTNKFLIPGRFEWPNFNYDNVVFKLEVTFVGASPVDVFNNGENIIIIARPRTNLI